VREVIASADAPGILEDAAEGVGISLPTL